MNPLFNIFLRELLNSTGIEELSESKKLIKEDLVYDKGDFKTKITHYFTEDGYFVGIKSSTEAVVQQDLGKELEKLEQQKKEALEVEDYLLAKKLNDQIKELKTKTNDESGN